MESNPINDAFEASFLGVPLETQAEHCDSYELAPLFRRLLPANQPILEAGSGSGRWVIWFVNQGWQAAGLDWSATLCRRARAAVPGGRFEVGDMRCMPFADEEFGSVVALGSIEHAAEGPIAALREFARVLRPGGIAVVTVPNGSTLSRAAGLIRQRIESVKANRWIRRAFRRPSVEGSPLSAVRASTRSDWYPVFAFGKHGWFFYEYHFNRSQMRAFLQESGLVIEEEFAAFKDEGVMHRFGRLAGTFNYARGEAELTAIGRGMKRMLPADAVGLMLVFVARKPNAA